MEPSIQGNGLKIYNMEMVKNNGLMVLVMMVNFISEKNKDKDDLYLVMDQFMRENSLII